MPHARYILGGCNTASPLSRVVMVFSECGVFGMRAFTCSRGCTKNRKIKMQMNCGHPANLSQGRQMAEAKSGSVTLFKSGSSKPRADQPPARAGEKPAVDLCKIQQWRGSTEKSTYYGSARLRQTHTDNIQTTPRPFNSS